MKRVSKPSIKAVALRFFIALALATAFVGIAGRLFHVHLAAYARTLAPRLPFMRPHVASIATISPVISLKASASIVYPAAGWLPFKTGPLVTTVASAYGSHPALATNSAGVIDNLWKNDRNDLGHLQMVLGDSAHYRSVYGTRAGQRVTESFYFSHSSDPAYTMHCTIYGPCPRGVVHIPVNAVPAADSDHHLVIRDSASGKDFSFWQASIPSGTGGVLAVGSGDSQDSVTGEGIDIGGTASHISTVWAVRPQDVLVGRIPHALLAEVTCDTSNNGNASGSFVYPAAGTDNNYYCGTNVGFQFPNNSASNVNLEYGARVWSDVPNTALPPLSDSCDPVGRAELRALNEFGAFVTDVGDVGAPFYILVASDVNDTYNGGMSVWQQILEPLTGSGTRSSIQFSPATCGIDLSQHLHVLQPPSQK